MCTFALDSDDTDNESGFLIKPRPMPYAKGHPFEMLRNYEVADHFYPIGDVEQIEPLQLELEPDPHADDEPPQAVPAQVALREATPSTARACRPSNPTSTTR